MAEDRVPRASADFKLSITRALRDQLHDALVGLTPVSLAANHLKGLESLPGVYELYLRDQSGQFERVYVGKASRSLPKRLEQHRRKLSGRTNISINDVGFKCLYVDEDMESSAPEKMLIKKYKAEKGVPWNTNGFGNKDPGGNRDKTLVKENHFDAVYPINLDFEVDSLSVGSYAVKDYLAAIKKKLPFNLRFERDNTDLKNTIIELSRKNATARELILGSVAALPEGWQVTVLPGYVILYFGKDEDYGSARFFWRKESGKVYEKDGPHLLAAEGDVEEELETE
ncbi:Eco29kI family restriction endonuclease [Saccharopolyspora shandongensis]|uniref:Eco29kI family restriction endonuclease n=1 Tax=Saccharopolyspora shandongensis TaxID=418495 RepID=UPI0033FAB481